MHGFKVDLINCDKEPIRLLGKIQSHGVLVALQKDTLLIKYISVNVNELGTELQASGFLNKPLSVLENALFDNSDHIISQLINIGGNKQSFEAINPFKIVLAGRTFNLIISDTDEMYLVEFELFFSNAEINIQKILGKSVAEILSVSKLESILYNAAAQIRSIIGYDRVMIYKFIEEGHGKVVAEVKADRLKPYLGLHFPASDIPEQARELYMVNLTRIIADVDTESIPIISDEEKPVDLTNSVLRAVSPIHIQYLKNMGVVSSFSVSLIADGKLWGLVACHNYTPRFIDYRSREASKLIGQILSSALEYRQEEEDSGKINEMRIASDILLKNIRKTEDIEAALTACDVTFKDIVGATGAVLFFNESMIKLGDTPDDEHLRKLRNWLTQSGKSSVFFTEKLSSVYPEALAYTGSGSGIMVATLSLEMGEFMIWFKQEQLNTITWAGNPEKPVEISKDGMARISPRNSFEEWSEIVSGVSEKWLKEEIMLVTRLREEVAYAVNRKANEIRILNEKLRQAYEELDAFSYTISHDLKTPLSVIKNYSQILLRPSRNADPDTHVILNNIVRSADKMNAMIRDVLGYSRTGRAELKSNLVDMRALLSDLKAELEVAFNNRELQLEIGNTPDINGDITMIGQVFSNLLNNAVKYSSNAEVSVVKVNGEKAEDGVTYTISDNGVGIDERNPSSVFDLFQRMDNAKAFAGSGVGLAIVKRIIEKHRGKIWFESELGKGTTFYVTFPVNG